MQMLMTCHRLGKAVLKTRDACRTVGGASIGLLPAALFANGHLFYTQGVKDWARNQRPGVIAAHTTFASGRLEKRHFMREKGLWKA